MPALLAAGLPPHLALGTNKGQSVWGSGAALVAFWRAGRVDRKQALFAFPLGLRRLRSSARTLVCVIAKDALRPIVIAMLIGAAVLLRRQEADARARIAARAGRSRRRSRS